MTTASFDPRTPEGVEHIARLSRLALDAEERAAMAAHLGRMLDYVAALEELDTEGVAPSVHERATARLREDAVAPSLAPEEAVANAPDPLEGGFGVPAVIGGEE